MAAEQKWWDVPLDERRRVAREGKLCTKCGSELGDEVYRFKPILSRGYYRYTATTDQDPICRCCAPDWLPELQARVYTVEQYSHRQPCNTCGREVFFVSGLSEHVWSEVYCCDECHANRPRKSKRSGPHSLTCEVCGKTFEAKRSDAKTCSAKCKQRAHRQRLRVSRSPSTTSSQT